MATAEAAFWGCALLIVYTYLAYPALLVLLAAVFGRPVRRGASRHQ